jgi:hypothetical protein
LVMDILFAKDEKNLINSNIRKKIEANIFYAAHPAIDDWGSYLWHSRNGLIDTHQPNSSQALSMDVFGTLKAFKNRAACDSVMNAIAAEMGIERDYNWMIDLGWMDKENSLKEPHRTQVDVKAQGQKNVFIMECKFTEPDAGSCSQVKSLSNGKHKGKRQCNGAYRQQINPANGRQAKCALTAKGIRYWELIPEIFNFDNHQEYDECPFKGGWFQWMRNLVLCSELARLNNLHGKTFVVYVDSPRMPFRKIMDSGEWEKFLGTLKKKSLLGTISYGQILEFGQEALKPFKNEQKVWGTLRNHVLSKIMRVESGINLPIRHRKSNLI